MVSMFVLRTGGNVNEYETEARTKTYPRHKPSALPYLSLFLHELDCFYSVRHPAQALSRHALRTTHSQDLNTPALITKFADLKIRAGTAADLDLDTSCLLKSDPMGLLIPRPLITVLHQNGSVNCARPEDRIYALMGLASESNRKGLTVDYQRPVQDKFVQAAWSMISSSGDLRLLSYIEERAYRKVGGLPTWVPDFSTVRKPYPLDTFTQGCAKSEARDVSSFRNTLLHQPSDKRE